MKTLNKQSLVYNIGSRSQYFRTASLLLSAIILCMISFSSCTDDGENAIKSGNIPGMGNAGGELQAVPYEFHQDLVLSNFTGVDPNANSAALKSTNELDVIIGEPSGSGDQVQVEIKITNTNATECRSAWFKAGTVFKANRDGAQNAILLAPVNICVPPASDMTFVLHLYCVNQGMDDSDPYITYYNMGTTESTVFLALIELLKYKMINIEHYNTYPHPGFNYVDVRNKLQEIVWEITNGDGTIDEAYINSLPDLPDGVYPEGVYLDVALPDCWCYDMCEDVANSGALSYVEFFTGCEDAPQLVDENGEPYPAPEGTIYTTNGKPFKVEAKAPSQSTAASIKFEENGQQIGEGGEVEIGMFTFWASCLDEEITVVTKNMNTITAVIKTDYSGQAVLMTNGFVIRFHSVVDADNGGYIYTFHVISDDCEGGQTN